MVPIIEGPRPMQALGSTSRSLFTMIALQSFCMAFGGQLVAMSIPIFILRHWDSNFFSGFSLALGSIAYVCSTLLFGRVAGKIGRLRAMKVSLAANFVIFTGVFAMFLLIQLPGHDWILPAVLVARALEGLATGFFWPNLEARISDVACCFARNDADRADLTGKGVSWFNLGWNVGLLASSLVFMIVMQHGWLELVVFLPIIIQGFNFILVIWYKDIGPSARDTIPSRYDAASTKTGKEPIAKSYPIFATLGILLVFFYGVSLNWIYATTTNFLNAIGVVPLLGLLEALRVVAQTVTSIWFKRGSMLKTRSIVITCTATVVMTLFMGLSANEVGFTLLLAWFPILGLVQGTMYAEALNMVALSGTSEKKGHLMGMFESIGSTGNFTGPLLAGYITQVIVVNRYPMSYFIATACFAGLLVVITVMLALSLHKQRNDVNISR